MKSHVITLLTCLSVSILNHFKIALVFISCVTDIVADTNCENTLIIKNVIFFERSRVLWYLFMDILEQRVVPIFSGWKSKMKNEAELTCCLMSLFLNPGKGISDFFIQSVCLLVFCLFGFFLDLKMEIVRTSLHQETN